MEYLVTLVCYKVWSLFSEYVNSASVYKNHWVMVFFLSHLLLWMTTLNCSCTHFPIMYTYSSTRTLYLIMFIIYVYIYTSRLYSLKCYSPFCVQWIYCKITWHHFACITYHKYKNNPSILHKFFEMLSFSTGGRYIYFLFSFVMCLFGFGKTFISFSVSCGTTL